MGIVSFFKEAGQKLFGHKDAEATAQQAQAAPDDAAHQARLAEANAAAAAAIVTYIETQNLSAAGLTVEFDAVTSTV